MKHLLIEHSGVIQDEHHEEFSAFVCDKLGLSHCPPITFVKHTGNASFGSYSPSEGMIVVATSGRHEADVLRTLAHELVHDYQITTGTEQTLEEMEYEANAIAGMLMRDWNKAHPELYGVTHSDNPEGVEGESWGGDPTRPSGPINMAEQHEIVLWGLPKGETDRLHERVLSTQCKTKTDLDAIKNRASKDGWHSFRTSKLDLTKKPDFVNAIKEHYRGLKGYLKPTNFGMTAAEKIKHETQKKANKEEEDYNSPLENAHWRAFDKYWMSSKKSQMKEDATVNAAGSGQIAGLGVGPQGEPGFKKKTQTNMIRRKPKSPLAQIFTGFPKPPKLFKEYKAEITKKIDWDKDSVSPQQVLMKKKKTLASLGLPHPSLRQIIRGR